MADELLWDSVGSLEIARLFVGQLLRPFPNHVIDSCPSTKFESGLQKLHKANDNKETAATTKQLAKRTNESWLFVVSIICKLL